MGANYFSKLKQITVYSVYRCCCRAIEIVARDSFFLNKLEGIFPRFFLKLRSFYWHQRNKKYQLNEYLSNSGEVMFMNQYMKNVIEQMRIKDKFRTIK